MIHSPKIKKIKAEKPMVISKYTVYNRNLKL